MALLTQKKVMDNFEINPMLYLQDFYLNLFDFVAWNM
jgi:hypothetical protein